MAVYLTEVLKCRRMSTPAVDQGLRPQASDLRPRETVTTITHDTNPDPEFLETRGIAEGRGCKRPSSQITPDCTRRAVTSMFIVFLLHLPFSHLIGIYLFLPASFLEGCPFLPSPLVTT